MKDSKLNTKLNKAEGFLMNPLRKYSTHGWELQLTLNNS